MVSGRIGNAGTAGDVVDHNGQIGGVGDGFNVGLDAGLARLVVVRGDNQLAVRPAFAARLAISIECEVWFVPVPAMTFARSPTAPR